MKVWRSIRRAVYAVICVCVLFGHSTQAQTLARVIADQSTIQDHIWGQVSIELALTQGVPYRIFFLNGPDRLVIDFNELRFDGLTATTLGQAEEIPAYRFGSIGPGWSRMVFDLSRPMELVRENLAFDPQQGLAKLTLKLRPSEREDFDAVAGVPDTLRAQQRPEPSLTLGPPSEGFVVFIDAGHGGIDPGAVEGALTEAELMMSLARRLREEFRKYDGVSVVLSRSDDHFVSLEDRIAFAHAAQANVFLSLHADAVTEGVARGATVYTLSENASDEASAKLAERHRRDEILAGVDLGQADDEIANVLMDMARRDTGPKSIALAQAVIEALRVGMGDVNSRPHRTADFSVLKSASIPSILIEAGFLSTRQDRENLMDPAWRSKFAQSVALGVLTWADQDKLIAPLRRQ